MSFQEIYCRRKTGFIASLIAPGFENEIKAAQEQFKEGLAKHGSWTAPISSRQATRYFEFGLEEPSNYLAFALEEKGKKGRFKEFESEILHKGKDNSVNVKIWFVQFPKGKPIVLRVEADLP